MKLKFNGPRVVIRQMGEVVWGPENHYIAETPVAMAADLLTSPGDEFTIVEADRSELAELGRLLGVPLAKIMQRFGGQLPKQPAVDAVLLSPAPIKQRRRGKQNLSEVKDD
jgi:hypothetical protein